MQKTPSEKKKGYLIKIIPDQGDRMHSLRLPKKLVKYGLASCAATAVLFVGSFGYAVYSAFNAAADRQEIKDLRTVNSSQQEQLSQLAKKANELQDEMDRINEFERELRQMTGTDPVAEAPESPAGDSAVPHDGQGGPWIEPEVTHVNSALDSIRKRLEISKANLAVLREALKEQQHVVSVHGHLSAYVPSIWPTYGDVSSPYGLRWGGSDFHPGIDIANDYGTPIVAAASGTVTDAGWNSGGYGNMVDIDHGNGVWTRYAHAEALAVEVGQTVQKGQVIAYMGSTGFSTGPHLHYEVHANGEIVNPILYLGGGE